MRATRFKTQVIPFVLIIILLMNIFLQGITASSGPAPTFLQSTPISTSARTIVIQPALIYDGHRYTVTYQAAGDYQRSDANLFFAATPEFFKRQKIIGITVYRDATLVSNEEELRTVFTLYTAAYLLYEYLPANAISSLSSDFNDDVRKVIDSPAFISQQMVSVLKNRRSEIEQVLRDILTPQVDPARSRDWLDTVSDTIQAGKAVPEAIDAAIEIGQWANNREVRNVAAALRQWTANWRPLTLADGSKVVDVGTRRLQWDTAMNFLSIATQVLQASDLQQKRVDWLKSYQSAFADSNAALNVDQVRAAQTVQAESREIWQQRLDILEQAMQDKTINFGTKLTVKALANKLIEWSVNQYGLQNAMPYLVSKAAVLVGVSLAIGDILFGISNVYDNLRLAEQAYDLHQRFQAGRVALQQQAKAQTDKTAYDGALAESFRAAYMLEMLSGAEAQRSYADGAENAGIFGWTWKETADQIRELAKRDERVAEEYAGHPPYVDAAVALALRTTTPARQPSIPLVKYEHPGGAFSVLHPTDWAVCEEDTGDDFIELVCADTSPIEEARRGIFLSFDDLGADEIDENTWEEIVAGFIDDSTLEVLESQLMDRDVWVEARGENNGAIIHGMVEMWEAHGIIATLAYFAPEDEWQTSRPLWDNIRASLMWQPEATLATMGSPRAGHISGTGKKITLTVTHTPTPTPVHTPTPTRTPTLHYAKIMSTVTALQATVQTLKTQVAVLSTALAKAQAQTGGTPFPAMTTLVGKWELAGNGGDCFGFLEPETIEFFADGTYVGVSEFLISQQMGGHYTLLDGSRLRFEVPQTGLMVCDLTVGENSLILSGSGGDQSRYVRYEELPSQTYSQAIIGQWEHISGYGNTCFEPFNDTPDQLTLAPDGKFVAGNWDRWYGQYTISGSQLRMKEPFVKPTPTPLLETSSANSGTDLLLNLLGTFLGFGYQSGETPPKPFEGTAMCQIKRITHAQLVLSDNEGNQTAYRRTATEEDIVRAAQATSTALAKATPTPTPVPTPTPTPTPHLLSVIPFDLQVEDIGEGWSEGTLHLAFENTSDTPLLPQCWIFQNELEKNPMWEEGSSACGEMPSVFFTDAYIKTLEGKTYPAEVSSPVLHLGNVDSEIHLPVPPGFPFQIINNRGWGTSFDSITFQFARSAHPTNLVLSSTTDVTIDLASVPQEIPTPDLGRYHVRTVSELANTPLLDIPGKLKLTFDGACFHKKIPGFFGKGITLPWTMENRNQLDGETANINFFYVAYYPGGLLDYWTYPFEWSMGPGQTDHSHEFMLDKDVGEGEVPASYLIVYGEDNDLQVYNLDCEEQ